MSEPPQKKRYKAWIKLGPREWCPVEYSLSQDVLGAGSEGEVVVAELHRPTDRAKHGYRFPVKIRRDLYQIPTEIENEILFGEMFAMENAKESVFINGAASIQHTDDSVHLLFPTIMRTSLANIRDELVSKSSSLRRAVFTELLPPLGSFFLRLGSFFEGKNFRHGDLKLENILLSYEQGYAAGTALDQFNRIKASDYGQGYHMADDQALMGSYRGTPAFHAPETAQDTKPFIHSRSEVFTVGLCLFELCGMEPKSVRAMLQGDAELRASPLPRLLNKVIPYLEGMMSLDPFNRPSFNQLSAQDPLRDSADQEVVDLACSVLTAMDLACMQSPTEAHKHFPGLLKEVRSKLATVRAACPRDPVSPLFLASLAELTHGPILLQSTWNPVPVDSLRLGAQPIGQQQSANVNQNAVGQLSVLDQQPDAWRAWIDELHLPEAVVFVQRYHSLNGFDPQKAQAVEEPLRTRIKSALAVVIPEIIKASKQSLGLIDALESVKKNISQLAHPALDKKSGFYVSASVLQYLVSHLHRNKKVIWNKAL